ncbi:hypothetical protein Hdeb2414_s0110g00797941 [Helianthus debilis subsp. tardiflorus]
MADVMPRGHGGDGADEPPPGGFGRRGHHEEDLVPKKKTRGRAKNKKLLQANKMGGLVSIPFDRLATYTPVGDACDMFSRERRFNFEEIERDCERRQLKGGIRSVYMKRYRDRKSMAKKEFDELFEDPRFMERLYKAMDKKESRKGNENDTDEEGE